MKAKKRKPHLFLLLCFCVFLCSSRKKLWQRPVFPGWSTRVSSYIILQEYHSKWVWESLCKWIPLVPSTAAIYKGVKQACVTLPQIIKSGEVHSNSESNRCKDHVCFWASLLTGFQSDKKIVFDNWFQCLTSEKTDFHFQRRWGVLVLRETFWGSLAGVWRGAHHNPVGCSWLINASTSNCNYTKTPCKNSLKSWCCAV